LDNKGGVIEIKNCYIITWKNYIIHTYVPDRDAMIDYTGLKIKYGEQKASYTKTRNVMEIVRLKMQVYSKVS